jgi:hypothetical protein
MSGSKFRSRSTKNQAPVAAPVGVPRIGRTFVFDENITEQEYMQYIDQDFLQNQDLAQVIALFETYRQNQHKRANKHSRYDCKQFSCYFNHPEKLAIRKWEDLK